MPALMPLRMPLPQLAVQVEEPEPGPAKAMDCVEHGENLSGFANAFRITNVLSCKPTSVTRAN